MIKYVQINKKNDWIFYVALTCGFTVRLEDESQNKPFQSQEHKNYALQKQTVLSIIWNIVKPLIYIYAYFIIS